MSGADDDRAQHAGLDQHDRSHVILRDPVLALRHLAHHLLVDRRRILRRIAPFEPAQPGEDADGGEGNAGQTEQDRPRGIVPRHRQRVSGQHPRD